MLVGVICVLSLALLFATFTNSSLTAAIAALVVFIVMNILGRLQLLRLSQALPVHEPHRRLAEPAQPADRRGIPIITGLITFAIYIAGLMAVAWYLFRRKDILV